MCILTEARYPGGDQGNRQKEHSQVQEFAYEGDKNSKGAFTFMIAPSFLFFLKWKGPKTH